MFRIFCLTMSQKYKPWTMNHRFCYTEELTLIKINLFFDYISMARWYSHCNKEFYVNWSHNAHLGKILLFLDLMLPLLMALPEFMGPNTLTYCMHEGNSVAVMVLIVSLGLLSGFNNCYKGRWELLEGCRVFIVFLQCFSNALQ